MHHKADALFRDAGFANTREPDGVNSLFGTSASSQNQREQATQDLTERIDQPQSLTQGDSESASTANGLVTQNDSSQTASPKGFLSSLTGAASNLFGGGNLFGDLLGGGLLGDLFSGISSLFGGGQSQPPPLIPYDAPQSQDFELAMGGGQIGDAVYNRIGDPRVAQITEPAFKGLQDLGSASTQAGGSDSIAKGAGTASSPQITLNVQAMDSQSFLDRSQDIAQAVRQAMLNMHSINDVISDL